MKASNKAILEKLIDTGKGYYTYNFSNNNQLSEANEREKFILSSEESSMDTVSAHHSIPVMDREVRRFLKKIPKDGTIIDAGGGYGWHWRNLHNERPDVNVFIVDIVPANFIHAKRILQKNINQSIFLIYGDACSLPFPDNFADGYWTVQAFQHIPDYEKAVKESFRILKPKGILFNINWNSPAIIKLIYRMFGKKFRDGGILDGLIYLDRTKKKHIEICKNIYGDTPTIRYTENFFNPDIRLNLSGKENSFLGKIDSYLSSSCPVLKLWSRQISIEVEKQIP